MSILVATFNQEIYLRECLNSIEAQDLPRDLFEVIVVNDGSTDGTGEILAGFPRIKVVEHDKRRGLVAACNSGLEVARGNYFVRVDSDDWLAPDALAVLMRASQEHPEASIFIPSYWIVDGGSPRLEVPDLSNLFTWVAGGPLLDREAVLKVGGYRDFFWEEWDLYLRMLTEGYQSIQVDHPVLFHREHHGSMTARAEARKAGWTELLNAWPRPVLKKHGFEEKLVEVD